MFCIYLRTNSDLCHLQNKLIGFHNRDGKCLQRGTDWGFKYNIVRFVFKGLRKFKVASNANARYSVPEMFIVVLVMSPSEWFGYRQRNVFPPVSLLLSQALGAV
jgi:uncharacterized membrane protein (UPF0136 family)